MPYYPQKITKKRSVKLILARIGVVFWVISICFLSFSPLNNVKLPNFFSADKIAHIGMYFVLVCLLALASTSKIKWYYSLIFALIFSSLTELIQHYFIVNRYGEIGDFIANLLGIGVGIFIFKDRIKT